MQPVVITATLALIAVCLSPTPGLMQQPAKPITISYEKSILPLLQQHCYQCHDGKQQKAGLRLDVRSRAKAGGESGKAALVPGKPEESELYRRLNTTDENDIMPPGKKKKLTVAEQKLIKDWITSGATWPEQFANEKVDPRQHWAFQPPKQSTLPAVHQTAWVRNPIDQFILARLEKENLHPSAEADKLTLLRRLHLDLTGLPPTIAEIDTWIADTSPQAYEKLVDRLLASPHYGERWARHWLDAARYADSDGYEKDKSRQMWFYRDWVVNAFNRDLPYVQFLREQLAGDLLPQATQDQTVATGFLRNSMLNEEGGVDPEQFRMDAMFDRVDAIGKAMLGITIQCAQCHTHKFDPITHEEYYRLFAYLNNDHEAQRVVYAPTELMQVADLLQKMQALEAELKHRTPDWQTQLASWEAQLKKLQPTWTVLPQLQNAGDNSQRYIPQKDGSILALGYAPTKFDTHLQGSAVLPLVKAFRLELLNDPNLPCNGPGRSFMGTCALSEFKVQVTPKPGDKKQAIKFTLARADFSNDTRALESNFDDRSNKKRVTGAVTFAIDGKNETAWGIDQGPGRRNRSRIAVFIPDKPITLPAGSTLDIYLTQQHGGWNSDDHMNNNLGRFRLSVTDEDVAEKAVVPPYIAEILAVTSEQRTAAQQATLFSYWRTTVSAWQATNEQIEAWWKQWPTGSTSLTMQARDLPRDTKLLKRGDFLQPDKAVQAGVPAFLHPLPPNSPPTRLTLARWLTDRQSPTTARVFVNRVWQSYFGIGLVATPEDLGVQSETPSHPELFDWLAVEFMKEGWSIKKLHRIIVTSATYRQSSKATPDLLRKDPYNRLLARMPRLRVDGEVVRDISLAASGLLNPQVGGPSVFAPAPAFLFQPPASYGPFTWSEATGPERYRRALYTFRRRSTPYPMLTNFDAPNGDSSCVRRTRSNTPLQALTTLNETLFIEAARALGQRMVREGGTSDADRLQFGFRLCTSRTATASELATLEKLLTTERTRFAEGWVNPNEVLGNMKLEAGKAPAGVTPTQWASYTLVARVLLNLDETITRE